VTKTHKSKLSSSQLGSFDLQKLRVHVVVVVICVQLSHDRYTQHILEIEGLGL